MTALRTGLLCAVTVGLLWNGSRTAAAEPTTHACVSANESGQDLLRARKLRAARARFGECSAESCPGAVRKDCGEHLAEIDRAMPSMVFELRDARGDDVPSVRVAIDGEPQTEPITGTALDVDPGEHEFAFEAAGGLEGKKTFVVHEGDKGRHERVVLVAPAPPGATRPTASAEGSPSEGHGRRTVALAAGGVGVAGLAVGTVFGVLALSKRAFLDGPSECGSNKDLCPPSAAGDIATLNTLRVGADVGFGVGVVGAVLSGILFLTSPAGESKPATVSVLPWVGPGSGGLAVRF